MGKHSSDAAWPFYRSIVGWLLPWTLLLTTLVVGTWYGMNFLGGEEMEPPPPATSSSPTPTASPTPKPSPSPTPSPSRPRRPRSSPSPTPKQPQLITERMSVQVLNATGHQDADNRVADRLMDLGFRVVALGGANREYQRTTVFWSYRESKRAAELLADEMGWQVGPKPSNLSTTVALHVIVGLDEV